MQQGKKRSDQLQGDKRGTARKEKKKNHQKTIISWSLFLVISDLKL